ncbi:hypothetical protein GBF38_013245 [Nibea albiflora]|uniref:Uncharacterized protein n=1 Tax=Nibea albiflora TaxID=240163 RepID=A0ACB7F0G2_NIBAL|nr:hypothetical protein GBF38_013245 [Nibea albiflora]
MKKEASETIASPSWSRHVQATPLQLQDPDCCCSSCFHSISLPFALSFVTSLPPSFFVDALAPNIPSGRRERETAATKRNRENTEITEREEERGRWST